MAYFYVDVATGTDSVSNGGSWAAAVATLKYLIDTATTKPAAGDTVFMRANSSETTKETYASTTTITTVGVVANPVKIIGVVSGTTNEGTSVVAADVSARGVDQPVIEVTGANNDLTIAGDFVVTGLHISATDRITTGATDLGAILNSCVVDMVDIRPASTTQTLIFNDCAFSGRIWPASASGIIEVNGGIYTGTETYFIRAPVFPVVIRGVDLSQGSLTSLVTNQSGNDYHVRAVNCKIPSTFSAISTPQTVNATSMVELINCSDGTSKAATTSYQDYEYQDLYGGIEGEFTIVRTSGADDAASGGFAYAMTPNVDKTTEGAGSLKSPWMNVWLDGTTNTLTIYFANDAPEGAAGLYKEDEVWVEWYTPDVGDTAQHDQTFTPADVRLLDSSTPIAADASATWHGSANNHQKLTTGAITTRVAGWAYARLHLAKRSAAPDTLFLDPKIEVS